MTSSPNLEPYAWLPSQLEPVALRLARADQLTYEIGEVVGEWSLDGHQAKSAVLATSGKPGGHRSFAGLVQAAVEREVQRLAEEFNDGQPYESHQGEFRRGRPFS